MVGVRWLVLVVGGWCSVVGGWLVAGGVALDVCRSVSRSVGSE